MYWLIELLHRVNDLRLGRRLIRSMEELELQLRNAQAAFERSYPEGMGVLSKMRFKLPKASRGDPFSRAYKDAQMNTYKLISGRSAYDAVSAEVSDFNVPEAKRRPYPYSTQSNKEVGDQLIAQGHLIRSLPLKPGAKIIEFGSGWGNLTLQLALMGYDVTSVEIDPSMRELQEHRAKTLGLPVKVLASDMLGFQVRETYDAVIFFESFHHCEDPMAMLAKVHSMLDPDGVVVFGSEPVAWFSQPWGIRGDGLTLWSIRTYGWLEFGFNRRFWRKMLKRAGFSAQRSRLMGVSIADAYICRKLSPGQVPLSDRD